jgi:hypothetical protein
MGWDLVLVPIILHSRFFKTIGWSSSFFKKIFHESCAFVRQNPINYDGFWMKGPGRNTDFFERRAGCYIFSVSVFSICGAVHNFLNFAPVKSTRAHEAGFNRNINGRVR